MILTSRKSCTKQTNKPHRLWRQTCRASSRSYTFFSMPRQLRVTFPDKRDRERTFEVAVKVHFLFCGRNYWRESKQTRVVTTPIQIHDQTSFQKSKIWGWLKRAKLGISHSPRLETVHRCTCTKIPAGLC